MITIYASLKSLSNATLIRELCIPFKVGYTASNIYYDSKFSVDKYAVRQYTSVKIASTFTSYDNVYFSCKHTFGSLFTYVPIIANGLGNFQVVAERRYLIVLINLCI